MTRVCHGVGGGFLRCRNYTTPTPRHTRVTSRGPPAGCDTDVPRGRGSHIQLVFTPRRGRYPTMGAPMLDMRRARLIVGMGLWGRGDYEGWQWWWGFGIPAALWGGSWLKCAPPPPRGTSVSHVCVGRWYVGRQFLISCCTHRCSASRFKDLDSLNPHDSPGAAQVQHRGVYFRIPSALWCFAGGVSVAHTAPSFSVRSQFWVHASFVCLRAALCQF